MATSKKAKPVVKKRTHSTRASTGKAQNGGRVQQMYQRAKKRLQNFRARRPHRSFRRSRRRDFVRSLQLPGYWAFTNEVRRTLWQSRRLLVWVVIVYAMMSAVLVGLASQDTYTTLSDTLRDTSGDFFDGNWGEIGKASLLLASSVTGSLTSTSTEAQQIYGGLIALLIWLTTVWLLRAIKAGQRPRFRDGLYNASAPLVSTVIVVLVLIVQLIPAGLAAIGFSAVSSSGFSQGGVEGMLFTVIAGLLVILSMYWVTSSLIALTVVTLPGMYPLQALKTAGDMVVGRRLRILYRWLWLGGLVVVSWILVMIPIIIFDTWLKSLIPAISWLPIVPLTLLIMSSLTILTVATYVYLLYRRVVEDDAAPA